MLEPIKALFASRKFVLLLLVAIVGAVFVGLGKLPLENWATFVGAGTGLLIAAIAHEDAAAKTSAPSTNVQTVSIPPGKEGSATTTNISMAPPPLTPPAEAKS